jgi:hypothetical protein
MIGFRFALVVLMMYLSAGSHGGNEMTKLEITAFLALFAVGFLVHNETIASAKDGDPCTATGASGHSVAKGTYSTNYDGSTWCEGTSNKDGTGSKVSVQCGAPNTCQNAALKGGGVVLKPTNPPSQKRE